MTTVPIRRQLGALASFRGKYRVLHLTTLAFFLSFVVWFDAAPFALAIGKDLSLTRSQLVTLTLANLALTVPARIGIGMLLDRYGPRRVYAGILVFSAVPNTLFATAHSFAELLWSRLLLGIVGAGFVAGIRMVAEWFDRAEMGAAEGIYGGWGNFGSAAAALALPTLATSLASGPSAWRWGVGVTGAVAAGYGLFYLFAVQDTPEGRPYQRPHRQGALEVTSPAGVAGLLLLQLPLVGALGLVSYRIARVHEISASTLHAVWAALAVLLGYLWTSIIRVNRPALAGAYPVQDRYPFRAVALLSLSYSVSFGTELAVVGLLPTYFATTFGLGVSAAAAAGSAFAVTNLVTRPGGGLLSDALSARWPALGRRRTLRLLLTGAAVLFTLMSRLSSAWPLWAGVAMIALASVFIQGGSGAVFAMVPLVKHRVSGQIAGIAGSYGNVGGIGFAALLAFTAAPGAPAGNTSLLFLVIAVAAAITAAACRWLPEPGMNLAPAADQALADPVPVSRPRAGWMSALSPARNNADFAAKRPAGRLGA